jgi:hypothetical protein
MEGNGMEEENRFIFAHAAALISRRAGALVEWDFCGRQRAAST